MFDVVLPGFSLVESRALQCIQWKMLCSFLRTLLSSVICHVHKLYFSRLNIHVSVCVELQVCIGRISSLLMKYVLRHVHEKKMVIWSNCLCWCRIPLYNYLYGIFAATDEKYIDTYSHSYILTYGVYTLQFVCLISAPTPPPGNQVIKFLCSSCQTFFCVNPVTDHSPFTNNLHSIEKKYW